MTPKYNKNGIYDYEEALKQMQSQGQGIYNNLMSSLGNLSNNADLSVITKGVNDATSAVKDFLNPDSKLNLWNFTQPKSQRDKEATLNQLNNSVMNYKGTFSDQLNDIVNKINNREAFSYDLNGDTVWQNAKDQYLKNAKMGMTDAIAQASALTGGYGNSYATQAGYQAYQNNLDSLNDMIPGLYEAAMQRYQMEGDDLRNRYGVLADMDNAEYQRLLGNRDFAYNDWANERDYQTKLNQYQQQMLYQGLRDLVGDAKWGADFTWGAGQDLFNNGLDVAKFGYTAGRDLVDDAKYGLEYLTDVAKERIKNQQIDREFNEDVRRYGLDYALKQAQLAEDQRQFDINDEYRRSQGNVVNAPKKGSSEYVSYIKDNYGYTVDKNGFSEYANAYVGDDGALYYDKSMTKTVPSGFTAKQVQALGSGNLTNDELIALAKQGLIIETANGDLMWVTDIKKDNSPILNEDRRIVNPNALGVGNKDLNKKTNPNTKYRMVK